MSNLKIEDKEPHNSLDWKRAYDATDITDRVVQSVCKRGSEEQVNEGGKDRRSAKSE